MDPSEAAAQAAAVESARQRVKRATGQLKEASRDLATFGDGLTVLEVHRVYDADTEAAARDAIAVGKGRFGAVDVVVIARPQGRRQHPPTTAADAAKENGHAEGQGPARRAGRRPGAPD